MRFVDLFCGAGGFALGLADAGLVPLGAYDCWEPALRIHRANLPDHPTHRLDLADVDAAVAAIHPLRPDLIAGGPPCQEFSVAGPRREGARADLTVAFARIVVRVAPRIVVLENVPEALDAVSLARARRILRDTGYGITAVVLDAGLVGVAQFRRRLVMVGVLDGEDGAFDRALLAGLRRRPPSVRDALGPSCPPAYYRHPRHYHRQAVFSADEPSPAIRGVNRPVAPGLPGHANDAVPLSAVAPLTVEQRGVLQGFPPTWRWMPPGVSRAAAEQAVGNAVPPPLAEHVGRAVLAFLRRV